jgi:hypothetical protein
MEHQVETVDALQNINQESFPEIPNHLSNFIELQRGLLNTTTGIWERVAEVRELNGYDEERIASLENRKNITYAEYITEILKMGVVSLGSISNFQSRLDDLAIGDRNSLFLAIVRTTYGRERSFDRTCDSCNKINKITIDLVDDFPVVVPSFDPTDTLKVELRNGVIHELRIPTAADTLYVGKKAKTNAEQSTLLLARCSVWKENAPTNPEEWARSLGMVDRNKLIKELISIEMGPTMEEVDVDCVHCGSKITAMIDWVFLILG